MSDVEKSTQTTAVPAGDSHTRDHPVLDLSSWKYKPTKLGPLTVPPYASPETQLLLVSLVCFLCPGMFNALSGLGAGGGTDPRAADDANIALYSTFAVVGFFAGTFANKLGIKISLSFGGLGYCVYCIAFLVYKHTHNYGFNVFAGFLLGCCAGILWCAQGAIMMSYPQEHQKGRFISFFWIVFNLGGVIGSLVPLGENISVTGDQTVTDGTYIGFIVLTGLGAAAAFTLTDAKNVVRSDGSRIILMKNPTWKSELVGLWQTFQSDPYIVLMFPMFLSSNWFTAYQFNQVNAAMFNTRTRSLNGVLYWIAQMLGALVFGIALDYGKVRRTVRAKINLIVLMVLTMTVWGGGYAYQKTYTRALVGQGSETPDDTSDDYIKTDWTDSGYVGPMFLYIFYGFYDAAWQTSIYWFMGSLTNNSRKLANFAGFYKGIQSAGAAITWALDRVKTPYMTSLAVCWGLLAGSIVIAAPAILTRVKDTVTLEEDLKFSDETVEDVKGRGQDEAERA